MNDARGSSSFVRPPATAGRSSSPAPLLLFSVLLAVAGAVALVARPDSPYWAVAAPLGLLGVVLLAWRGRSALSPPLLVVAWALVPVVATRIAAMVAGDIAVADAVLGLVVALQAVALRSPPLVAGGLLCAVLATGFGLVLGDETARFVVISLTSGAALALAALGVMRS